MEKVYRIYFIKPLMLPDGPALFTNVLDRYGVRQYQSYEEAETIIMDNELEGATILPVYLNPKSTSFV